LHCPGITIKDLRISDLLAELADILSDGVSQDLWLLSVGIDNNPWGQYQPLIPYMDCFCNIYNKAQMIQNKQLFFRKPGNELQN